MEVQQVDRSQSTLYVTRRRPRHRRLVTDALSQTPRHRGLVTETSSQTPRHRRLQTPRHRDLVTEASSQTPRHRCLVTDAYRRLVTDASSVDASSQTPRHRRLRHRRLVTDASSSAVLTSSRLVVRGASVVYAADLAVFTAAISTVLLSQTVSATTLHVFYCHLLYRVPIFLSSSARGP